MAKLIWTPENKREFLNRYDRGDSPTAIVRWATSVGAGIGVTSIPSMVTSFRKDLTPVIAIPAPRRPKLENFSPERLSEILRSRGLTAREVGARIAQPVAWYLTGGAVPFADGPAERLAETLGVSVSDLQKPVQGTKPSLLKELEETRQERDLYKQQRNDLFLKLEKIKGVFA